MNPICFYHNADFDGLCSAAIVYRNVPGVELVGINYGDVFDFERVRGRKGAAGFQCETLPWDERP